MNLNDAFPSNFLKASDLGDRDVTLTITEAEMEEIGQDEKQNKLVISFKGTEKGLICNKTNATTIGKLYGDDTDKWIGQRITLMAREVEFKGESVMAIRVSLKKPAAAKAAAPVAPAAPEPDGEDAPF